MGHLAVEWESGVGKSDHIDHHEPLLLTDSDEISVRVTGTISGLGVWCVLSSHSVVGWVVCGCGYQVRHFIWHLCTLHPS
jgi:hypothetical protein